jgi:hypothetical protein
VTEVGGCKLALPTLGLAKRLGLELDMGQIAGIVKINRPFVRV